MKSIGQEKVLGLFGSILSTYLKTAVKEKGTTVKQLSAEVNISDDFWDNLGNVKDLPSLLVAISGKGTTLKDFKKLYSDQVLMSIEGGYYDYEDDYPLVSIQGAGSVVTIREDMPLDSNGVYQNHLTYEITSDFVQNTIHCKTNIGEEDVTFNDIEFNATLIKSIKNLVKSVGQNDFSFCVHKGSIRVNGSEDKPKDTPKDTSKEVYNINNPYYTTKDEGGLIEWTTQKVGAHLVKHLFECTGGFNSYITDAISSYKDGEEYEDKFLDQFALDVAHNYDDSHQELLQLTDELLDNRDVDYFSCAEAAWYIPSKKLLVVSFQLGTGNAQFGQDVGYNLSTGVIVDEDGNAIKPTLPEHHLKDIDALVNLLRRNHKHLNLDENEDIYTNFSEIYGTKYKFA